MGKIIGIVAEYNPFHAGHAYQIAKAREWAGEDSTVIAVMSGDFVQRGEWAIQPKAMRALSACRGGADAVFELADFGRRVRADSGGKAGYEATVQTQTSSS